MQSIPSVTAAIGIGSNLGRREEHVAAAFKRLGAIPSTQLLACSRVIETDPVGPVPQGAYLNAVATVRTSLSPQGLLANLLDIERSLGRDRTQELRWGPRTLDLDLLLYADQQIDEPGLVVPHPRLYERRFVLAPLAEVWPVAMVPGTGQTVAALLLALGPE